MTLVLIRKLLRDVLVALVVVMTLLFAFQLLWAKVTQRIVGEIIAKLAEMGIMIATLRSIIFEQSGQIVQVLMGGAGISIERAQDMMSISYVHPLTQIILCIWAVGRAAGALAGELDRGTMELLLAQPIRRGQVILAHLAVDAIVVPCLIFAMGFGTFTAVEVVGLNDPDKPALYVNARRFLPALVNVAALVFAVSGTTLAISSMGRQRGRVLGFAVLFVLLQFLVNVIGQLWPPLESFRPLTVFYYYQPQQIILSPDGLRAAGALQRIGVLFGVGAAGYGLAAWVFCRRDLPAPL